MTSPGSYVLPSSEGESDRLEAQAALYGGTAFLDPFLSEQPTAVLEVGCGTGFFVRYTAERLPGSRVVGLDMETERLAYAREKASQPELEFIEGDLLDLPFDEATFELVYSRFVMVHASDPTGALTEITRVTRPGGRVVAYDMVHDGIWFSPPRPALEELLAITMGVMRERGMEPSQGLHLAPALIRAGLVDVTAEAITHGGIAGQAQFEAHRANWIQTVAGLSETIGHSFEAALVERALEELGDQRPDQFLVELTVLASGLKAP